jgi:hypothetical protein
MATFDLPPSNGAERDAALKGRMLFQAVAAKVPETAAGSRPLLLQRPGLHALVDEESFEEASRYVWHLAVVGPYSCYVITRVSAATRCGFTTPSGKWCAKIRDGKQRLHLGVFVLPEDAARAYDSAARRLHGEFACVNFPRVGERGAF